MTQNSPTGLLLYRVLEAFEMNKLPKIIYTYKKYPFDFKSACFSYRSPREANIRIHLYRRIKTVNNVLILYNPRCTLIY